MLYLKADTNTEVLVGPAVDVNDGFTPITNLTLSGADEAELIKYGGASALTVTDISSNTFAAITGADGYYTCDLSTGNTDTEGFLVLLINDDSLILPIRHEFMVVNANVYDSLFAAATTDYLDTNVFQIKSNATAPTQLALSADTIESGAAEGTPSFTVIQTDLAETQDDIYIGRVVIFTSGNARGEATEITDYTGSTGTITVTALANAPAASDTFVII